MEAAADTRGAHVEENMRSLTNDGKEMENTKTIQRRGRLIGNWVGKFE